MLEAIIALIWLAFMEIVLGIDNLVFITILSGKLPNPAERSRARKFGLAGAMVLRLGLLALASWIAKLTAPLFTIFGHAFSGRDLILAGGGLFLLWKSVHELVDVTEVYHDNGAKVKGLFWTIVGQILLFDLVFSLDSVITAMGMAKSFWVMATAMVIAVGAMLVFSDSIAQFIERHPAMKFLALSFLVLIGVMLLAEGTGHHFPKGYIYFAMAYALGFQVYLEWRHRRTLVPVHLHHRFEKEEA